MPLGVLIAVSSALIWPFPDRMSAYVWRNWMIVPKERLAAAVGATSGDLTKIAAEMGLPDQGRIAPEWDTLGRKSIIRRNWNIVPRSQWLRLAPPDPKSDSNSGEADEYLKWHFGGGTFPEIPELRFNADEAAKSAESRREIARRLRREGVEMSDDAWRPFAFKRELDALSGVKSSVDEADRRFSLRFNCAYHGDWSDGLLEKNAAIGVNAIWVHADFASVVRDPKYPELGLDAESRFAEWNRLVAAAAKYGIKVFLFFNDPKQQRAEFFAARPERAAIRGMPDKKGENFSLCTSTAEVRRWLEDGMASVFSAVPGLGGFITITASEARTNCASRRKERGKCPRCRDRDAAVIFAEVHSAMSRGMRRVSPGALAVCWDWGWNEDEALRAIPLLPKGDAFLVMSEKGLQTVTGGVTNEVREYAISRIGPSGRARREYAAAKAAGLKVIAKVQPGASWEFSSVPCIPVPSLVSEHAARIAATEVDGVMLSWSCGNYPSENLRIFCDWPKCPPGPSEKLPGDRASEAFRAYPYNGGTLYCGNQHMGPGNPLYPVDTGKLATMTGIPYDNLARWVGNIPTNAWISAMEKVAAGFDGLAALHFRSAADQARFVMARNAGDVGQMRHFAAREIKTAKAAMKELCRDSRNAYELSNGYYYNLQDLREKILGCSMIVDPPSVFPEKTLSFPGSGCTSFAVDGRVLVAVSAWTRENGAVVFDVSDPANMRFAADMPARGYSTSDPILVGERVYQPLWYGVARVNLADPANPVLEELTDYDWSVHSADAIRRDGNELKFVSKRGVRVYDISDPSRPAVFLREEKTGERPRKTTSTKPVKVGDIVFSYDSVRSSFKSERVSESGRELLSERFLLHSLSTLAVIGKIAYISAATPRTTGVWTLDLAKSGVVDFGKQAIFRKPPAKGTQNFTMLMQTVGDIAPLGGGYLLADDAVVRVGSDGTMEALGEREKPVCNWSKDGGLIALAQSDRLRVLDVSNPESPRERAQIVFDAKYHVTGVAVKGDNLWAVVNEKPERRMHSPNAFLGYVPPVSTCIRYRIGREGLCAEASNTVPTSVSCEILAEAGGYRILYLAGTEGISLVDARTLSPIGRLSGLVSGAVYRIRRHGEFVYFTDSAEGVKELDVVDPRRPVLRRVFRRSRGGNPPYDGFTIADGRLYALSHSSLDVYLLSGGDTKGPPPSPRFALNFGAVERGSAPLPGGYEAVAFGEGGLFIRKDGRYVSELPAAVGGRSPLVASSVESEGGRLTVIDRSAREKVIVDASDPLLPVIVSRDKFDEK